jgi:dolichyl-phosphate-mannose--protein O-mannosyl transferase
MNISALKNAPAFRIRDLILISFALHLFAIGFPSDGGKVFDEAYYVPAAQDLIHGVPSNPEHPFLGKLWGSIGIAIFGDNWFGWRIPMVAFGLLTIYVFYHLARFFLDEKKSLIAATFFSVDTIFFIHSSVLVLDVPPIFFSILGFYLYFKNRYLLSASSFALAILSKESAVLFLLSLLIYHLILKRNLLRNPLRINKIAWTQAGRFVVVLISIVILSLWAYSSAYQPKTETEVQVRVITFVDDNGNPVSNITSTETVEKGQINNPIDQIKYIVSYQSSLTITNQSDTTFWNNYAWGWIIPYQADPPLYYQNTIKSEIVTKAGDEVISSITIEKNPISWRGIGNFPIWLSIWGIIPLVSINIIRKRATRIDYFIGAWILGTYIPWIFVSAFLERIVYAFYFINVVPVLALGIPYFVEKVSKGNKTREKIILYAWLAVAVLFFLYYYPVNVFEVG